MRRIEYVLPRDRFPMRKLRRMLVAELSQQRHYRRTLALSELNKMVVEEHVREKARKV